MTVSSTIDRNDYTGDNTTATYNYSFRITDQTHLAVYRRLSGEDSSTLLTLTTDYTVTGVGDGSGGTITLTAGNLATGAALTIRRVVPLKQESDYRNAGGVYPETIEQNLDLLTWICQQQQDAIDRSIQHDPTVSGVSNTMPAPSALKVVRWNTAGDALENVDPGSVEFATPGDGTVTEAKIANGAVTSAKIATGAVGTSDIADGAVTNSKIAANALRYEGVYQGAFRDSIGIVRAGTIVPFIGSSAPGGWLKCDGTTIGYSGSHADYVAYTGFGDPEDVMFRLWEILWAESWVDVLEWDGASLVTGTKGASAAADWTALKAIAIPDLSGLAIIGAGTGSGLTARTLGNTLGAETHQLTVDEMPSHTHGVQYDNISAGTGDGFDDGDGTGEVQTTSAGGDQPHNNMQPSFVANWIIKL